MMTVGEVLSIGTGIPRTEGPMKVPDEDAIAPKPKSWQILNPKIIFGCLPKEESFLMYQIDFPLP